MNKTAAKASPSSAGGLDAAIAGVLDHLDDAPAPRIAKTERPKPYVTALAAAKLFVDHSYQRTLDHRRVDKMVAEYDPTLLGVLEVSDRSNNQFAILEGQHRWAAATLAEGPGVHLVCQVHRGLSVEDEARQFYDMDVRRRALSGWDRWKARRGAGDPVVAQVEKIVASFGMRVDPGSIDGYIGSTTTLENVYELGGEALLVSTLTVLNVAYGEVRDAYDGQMIMGAALVMHNYDPRDELDVDRLISQLQGIVPRQVKARATALREAHRGQLSRLTAAVMIDRYNAAPGRKVDPFFTRVPASSKTSQHPESRQRDIIRRWAEREGMVVGKRLSATVLAAYAVAHPQEQK